jgi:hypothetical protein
MIASRKFTAVNFESQAAASELQSTQELHLELSLTPLAGDLEVEACHDAQTNWQRGGAEALYANSQANTHTERSGQKFNIECKGRGPNWRVGPGHGEIRRSHWYQDEKRVQNPRCRHSSTFQWHRQTLPAKKARLAGRFRSGGLSENCSFGRLEKPSSWV